MVNGRWAGVTGGQNAAVHGGKVRREDERRIDARILPQHHLHFGSVPMVEQSVGAEVLIDGAERGVGFGWPPGSAHPGSRIDDETGRLDHSSFQQGDNARTAVVG